MSELTGVEAALYGGLGGGLLGGVFALLGVVLGLVLEDRLRRRGEVRREVRAWVGGSTGGNAEERHFEVRFFNNRDVNIALWDLKVEFYAGEDLVATMVPLINVASPPYWVLVGPVDLPSRTSVYKIMKLAASEEALERLKRSDRVRFVATVVPGGARIVEPLRRWTPYEQAPS